MASDEDDIDLDLNPSFLLPTNSDEKEFKYIGLMVWHRRLCRQTITMQQLEGIVLDTLLMEPLFMCLRQSIIKKLHLPSDYSIYLDIKISTLKEILKSREFYESTPKNLNGRSLSDNIRLLEVVLCITKLNLLKPQEIKSIMIAFDLLTKHNLTNQISLQNEMHIEILQESLRFINRAISPKLVVDWCLRCHLFLDFSKSFHNPIHSKNQLYTKRFVMQKCKLLPHEFLSLMCNSVERQQMLLKAHNPDFNSKKIKISEETDAFNGEFRSQIYALDLTKKNFVQKIPTEVIIDQLNEAFYTALNPAQTKDRHEFRNYYGLIEPKPQFIKDTSGQPILDRMKKKIDRNLQAALTKKLEHSALINIEYQPNETNELSLNFEEVDLAEGVLQLNKCLNRIEKINHFAQGQQTPQSLKASSKNLSNQNHLSNLVSKLSCTTSHFNQRPETSERKFSKRSREDILTETKSIPYLNQDDFKQKLKRVSFHSPSNPVLQRTVQAVGNRKNMQQFQGTGPGQLAQRIQKAMHEQITHFEMGRTLNEQEDTRQEFFKIKMNLLSDLREAKKPVYLRKSGIRFFQRLMVRRIEEHEEKRSSIYSSEKKENGSVEIQEKNGFKTQKRIKTASEREKEEICKSKPVVQRLIEKQIQLNETLFKKNEQIVNFGKQQNKNLIIIAPPRYLDEIIPQKLPNTTR